MYEFAFYNAQGFALGEHLAILSEDQALRWMRMALILRLEEYDDGTILVALSHSIVRIQAVH